MTCFFRLLQLTLFPDSERPTLLIFSCPVPCYQWNPENAQTLWAEIQFLLAPESGSNPLFFELIVFPDKKHF